MGCRCCHMIQCYVFDAEGPPIDIINEGNNHSHKNSENGNHNQNAYHGPQVHQPQPRSEGLKNVDIKKGYRDFNDAKRNTNETGDEGDSKANGVLCSSSSCMNVNVNEGLTKDFCEEVQTVVPDVGREYRISSGISQESLLGKEPDLEIYTNRTLASDEPESLQDEICQSIEGNSSLTESAILDIQNDTVSQRNTHYLNDCYETDSLKSGNMARSTGQNKSGGNSSESIDSKESHIGFHASNQSFHAASGFGGIQFEGPTEAYRRRDATEDEDIDEDVAEALAALAAATAGEDEEEEVFNWENGY